MKLILARHGETISNRDGRIMGRSDSPLTGNGVEQARAIAAMLAQEGIQRIYCSPLGRAAATAAIYGEVLGFQPMHVAAMAELSCGRWEGKLRSEVTEGTGILRSSWTDRPPGGESYADAIARVRPFVDHLREVVVDETVLVVAHATVNRAFLSLWLSLEPHDAMKISSPHDTYYILGHSSDVIAKSRAGTTSGGLLLNPEVFMVQ